MGTDEQTRFKDDVEKRQPRDGVYLGSPEQWEQCPSANTGLDRQLELERKLRRMAEDELAAARAMLHKERLRCSRLQNIVRFHREQLLSPHRAADYLRLLWWILAYPRKLKAYREGIDAFAADQLRRLGVWLTSILIWWPMLIWLGLSWASGNSSPPPAVGFGLLAAGVLAWITTGSHSTRRPPGTTVTAVLLSAAVTLSTVSVLFSPVAGYKVAPLISLLGTLALGASATGLAVASVCRLSVAENIAGVTTLILGAGILVTAVTNESMHDVHALLVFLILTIVAGGAQIQHEEVA